MTSAFLKQNTEGLKNMDNQMNVIPLGTKLTSGEYLLGSKHIFKEYSTTPVGGVRTATSNIPIEAILVRNNSGGALTPGLTVKWDTANVGTQTAGVTGSAEVGCGVVDPYLPAGTTVAAGEVYWLIRRGRVRCTSGASYAVGAQLIPNSAGKMIAMTTDVAGIAARCGRACEVAGAADLSLLVYLDFQV